jgi:hypothetical protein
VKQKQKSSLTRQGAQELIRVVSDMVVIHSGGELDPNGLKAIAERIIDDRMGGHIYDLLDKIDTKSLKTIVDLINGDTNSEAVKEARQSKKSGNPLQ